MADHHYQPTSYYSTLGIRTPALRIRDGDRVFTSTVDAGGMDAAGNPAGGAGRKPHDGTVLYRRGGARRHLDRAI
jgi:hypothetical protein